MRALGAGAFSPKQEAAKAQSATHEVVAQRSPGAAREEWSTTTYDGSRPGRLEIGVAGGSLGWLSVRAEMTQDGAVHAFLRGTSTAAEETLRGHLGGMQSFLHAEQVTVGRLQVEKASTSGRGMDFTSDGGANRRDDAQRSDGGARSDASDQRAGGLMVEGEPSGFSIAPMARAGGGNWLSVMA